MYLSIIINSIKRIISNINFDKTIVLSVAYITCRLTCNPLFFRQVYIYIPRLDIDFKILNTLLLFPMLYAIINLIIVTANRNTAIFIIIVGAICEGFFSFSVSYATTLPIPNLMTKIQSLNTTAINIYGGNIWYQFKQSLFTEIFINILQIIIFSLLMKKIHNFFVSTMISVFTVLTLYNIVINYYIQVDKNHHWSIAFEGIIIIMSFLALYTGIFSIIIKMVRPQNKDETSNNLK